MEGAANCKIKSPEHLALHHDIVERNRLDVRVIVEDAKTLVNTRSLTFTVGRNILALSFSFTID